MNRYLRTIIAALALLLLVAGAAFAAPGEKGLENRNPAAASHQPSSEEPDESEAEQAADEQKVDAEDGSGPSSKVLDRIVENFANAGIETDADTVAGLAADYGVGGAVRILAWADAAGVDPSEITDMFDSGMGWGQIVKELNAADDSLHLSPGVGHVMSNGHGKGGDHPNGNSADAPGHNK
jgi:hypothetical protein